jgi:class 3 adenylate cyclase
MAPETRYAESPDGLIAYQVIGDGPIDLLYLSGATSHVDVRWEWEGAAHFLNKLASFSRLILFDRRGTGASDPISGGGTPTWEEWAEDLGIVLDAADSEQAAIFATLDGGPMAMVFAASHPDRTRALILSNTGAKLVRGDDYPIGLTTAEYKNLIKLLETRWGTEELAALNSPSQVQDPDFLRWFAKFMRASATPRATAANAVALVDYDVRGALGLIQAPTLVMHRRDYLIFPIEIGRYVAEHISGATFVELDGADSGLSWGPDVDFVLETIEEFLTGTRPVAEPDRVLATVLFTDIVGSTGHASQMGDRRWNALLDKHDALVKKEVERNRGRLLKNTGDGILATFDAPGRAIRTAISLRDGVRELGLETYIGLHTGEVELRGEDVGGIAVTIAARVLEEAKLAKPGDILVSGSIPPLVAGSGIEFDSVGGRELKGIPGEWVLFAVRA